MSWRYILEISYRNLVSQKSRSLLTIGGVGVGIATIIFFVSIGYGLQQLAINETIRAKSLNILDAKVGTGAITRIDSQVISDISNFNNVKAIFPRLETPSKFGLVGDESRIDLISFVNDNAFTEQTDTLLLTGRLPNDQENETIVTVAALRAIGVDQRLAIDRRVEILPLIRDNLTQSGQEENLSPIELTIVGIIDDSANPYLVIPIAAVRETAGDFSFTAAKVEVTSREHIEPVRRQVVDLGLEVEYIGDVVTELERIFAIVTTALAGFGVVATLVAALGMFNTMSVSLLERTREIGIMKTLGTQKRDVWRLFLTEGMLISLMGGLLGIFLGVVVGEILNLIFNIIAQATGNPIVDFYYSPPIFLLITFGLVILLGAVVGVIPARRATKISPLQALRYE